ncbi:elys-domaining containing [Trichoderma cornu-damae]|uniref:Elys-domaining containing n=1 Tax=Trichoderma cornu-damae TaxID=654480 RepID=A0A9P8TUX9_9HYPO|nr:elys-domaining containing [Trichoderma cornu-damae]
MFEYTDFQKIFPAGAQVPYDRKRIHEIEARRKDLGGQLFIDRVLRALGITKNKVYPPKNDNGVRQLHQQICESSMSMHHKLSLIYYVLLDFDTVDGQASLSETFASASSMPQKYEIFMKGLWYMDCQDFATALEYVAHPSLISDFADDIIIALVQHSPEGDYNLALSYFHTVQPVLKSSRALGLIFGAMAQTDVIEALFYSRTHPEHTRELLFRQLIAETLGHKSGQADELAFLPFDAAEDAWFEEYLSTGEGRNLKKAKDTLLVRKIAGDRFGEIRTQRTSSQWGPVLEGIKSGIEGQFE